LFEEISKKYWQSVCFFLQDVFDPISVAPTPILAPRLLVISQLIPIGVRRVMSMQSD
jgi:hypothetical protein